MGQGWGPSQCLEVNRVLRCLPLLAADDISLNSPGYMLTKLTRDILARDDELKVVSSQLFLSHPDPRIVENLGEAYTHGQSKFFRFFASQS